MRKLAFAALCGVLVLAGCGDDSRTSPMEPAPEADAAIRCIQPGFPLASVVVQIAGTKKSPGLYPLSRPRPLALALARAAEIAALWTLCKPDPARAKVAQFTQILLADFAAGRLTNFTSPPFTGQRVSTLINTLFIGVKLPPPNLQLTSPTGSTFGVGFFTPNQPLLVQARNPAGQVDGAVSLEGGAFTVPTIITFVSRPNFPQREGDPEVFPPFYEITASNTNPTPELEAGQFAVVGFCVEDALPGFPSDPVIAHIRFDGLFERLLDLENTDQYDDLELSCLPFGAELGFGSLFKGGFKDFATTAPRYFRAATAALFLPAKAEAAAAVGKTGLGGLARSLSPFAVTERLVEGSLSHIDPEFSSAEANTNVVRRVQLISGESSVQNAPVTFSTEDGSLGNEDTEQIVMTDADGQASVTWVLPSFPGVYTLSASVPGSSLTFTVAGADDGELTPLSCSLEGTIKSVNSFTPVDVTFTNNLVGDDISVFWLNFDGQREYPFEGGGIGVPYAVLNPDESYVQGTFVTHPWIVTTPGDPETCYGIFLPLSPGVEDSFGGTVTISDTF
jgi:hypothetical protein